MSDNQLVNLSKRFAVDIVNICTKIKEEKKVAILVNQLLRCGTSIGANIHEANYAASRADFINKLQIALKECYETDYWLELLRDTENLSEDHYKQLFIQCSKIRKIINTGPLGPANLYIIKKIHGLFSSIPGIVVQCL